MTNSKNILFACLIGLFTSCTNQKIESTITKEIVTDTIYFPQHKILLTLNDLELFDTVFEYQETHCISYYHGYKFINSNYEEPVDWQHQMAWIDFDSLLNLRIYENKWGELKTADATYLEHQLLMETYSRRACLKNYSPEFEDCQIINNQKFIYYAFKDNVTTKDTSKMILETITAYTFVDSVRLDFIFESRKSKSSEILSQFLRILNFCKNC